MSRIKSSNCPFCERENCSRPFGSRTVLSLIEWTVWGFSPSQILCLCFRQKHMHIFHELHSYKLFSILNRVPTHNHSLFYSKDIEGQKWFMSNIEKNSTGCWWLSRQFREVEESCWKEKLCSFCRPLQQTWGITISLCHKSICKWNDRSMCIRTKYCSW